ncbi:hypothetical protein RDI58_001162 [Solanum bulbocastanum]|uniref:Uncharacterized protein n=1 Tax=Solanum bulbocastanum TaxID=147425 RepID=A0AAN8U7G4_SOLBU
MHVTVADGQRRPRGRHIYKQTRTASESQRPILMKDSAFGETSHVGLVKNKDNSKKSSTWRTYEGERPYVGYSGSIKRNFGPT